MLTGAGDDLVMKGGGEGGHRKQGLQLSRGADRNTLYQQDRLPSHTNSALSASSLSRKFISFLPSASTFSLPVLTLPFS